MKIVPATCGSAPIFLVYGAEGRGKSSLAAKFPKPVAMLLERGLPAGVKLDAIDGLGTYANVLETMRELCRDPNGYQTLVIDTLDALEPLLLDHLCGQRGWKDIEQPSFGKGYVAADDVWRGFIKGITTLRDRHGFTIVLVAHSTVERFDDPRAPTYTQYAPRLHKRARALICDAADIIGFLAEDLRIATDDGGFRERVRATSCLRRQEPIRDAGEGAGERRLRHQRTNEILEPRPMTPPTFCAKFSDDETTRMSTHCPNGLDPARGIALSRAAYNSRKKTKPPEIVEARFETFDGVLLKQYSADEIRQIVKKQRSTSNV